MKCAVIDIGSNSLRLTAYDVNGLNFKTLFREKNMAGLAGYVDHGELSMEGILCAESALLGFRETLAALGIGNVSVFATASLRNISNSAEAVDALKKSTGFEIEVISGEEEAHMSYSGAMLDLHLIQEGAFVDIGGASTEIIAFSDYRPTGFVSYRIGSLNLYKRCVRRLLPGKKAAARITCAIDAELEKDSSFHFAHRSPLICVGGTARTVLKIAQVLFHLPEGCRTVSARQVNEILDFMLTNKKKAARLILRVAPDRIHTIIPGTLLLCRILHLFQSSEIIVSNYGVREGYLCKKIIQPQLAGMHTRKTEN